MTVVSSRRARTGCTKPNWSRLRVRASSSASLMRRGLAGSGRRASMATDSTVIAPWSSGWRVLAMVRRPSKHSRGRREWAVTHARLKVGRRAGSTRPHRRWVGDSPAAHSSHRSRRQAPGSGRGAPAPPGLGALGQEVGEGRHGVGAQVEGTRDTARQVVPTGCSCRQAGQRRTEPAGLSSPRPPRLACDRVVAVVIARRAIGEDVGGHQATA